MRRRENEKLRDGSALPFEGTSQVKVMLAGQQHLLGQLLSFLIEEEPGMAVAGICEDEASLSRQLDTTACDLMLLDPAGWNTPAADIVRQIAINHPQLRVIVLTVDPQADLLRDVLRAGAKACLTTDLHPDGVLAMIRSVASGVSAPGLTHPGSEFDQATKRRPGNTSRSLTTRQTDVLKVLVQGATNSEIAHQLGLREHTVKNYITEILSRFGVRDRTGAVVHALRTGLISESDVPTNVGQRYSRSGRQVA